MPTLTVEHNWTIELAISILVFSMQDRARLSPIQRPSTPLPTSATLNVISPGLKKHEEIVSAFKQALESRDQARLETVTDLIVINARRYPTDLQFVPWLLQTPWKQAAGDWDYFIDFVDSGHLRTCLGLPCAAPRSRRIPIPVAEGRLFLTFSFREIRGFVLDPTRSVFEPRFETC